VADGSLCTASAEQIFPRDSVQRNCFELALYTTRDHDCISNRIGSGLATFAALPTPSMIERAIIMLTDHRFWGHASGPSSSGKTPPIVPSITAMPLAAAPYRASGLVHWHLTDMAALADNVRCRGESGRSRVSSAMQLVVVSFPPKLHVLRSLANTAH
jgi:hypothetical protein